MQKYELRLSNVRGGQQVLDQKRLSMLESRLSLDKALQVGYVITHCRYCVLCSYLSSESLIFLFVTITYLERKT